MNHLIVISVFLTMLLLVYWQGCNADETAMVNSFSGNETALPLGEHNPKHRQFVEPRQKESNKKKKNKKKKKNVASALTNVFAQFFQGPPTHFAGSIVMVLCVSAARLLVQ